METATTLLRRRRVILAWMVAGGALAAILDFRTPPLFKASASFVPQGGGDAGRSGLASLAGQLGVVIPTGSQSFSLDFYSRLLESRVLLAPITQDTFTVAELRDRRMSFAKLFDIDEESPLRQQEESIKALQSAIGVTVTKPTGVVEVAVATKWRSVSLQIANALLDGVNRYNKETRQTQATAERRFVEARIAVAQSDLRQAENRLASFLETNRQYGGSPELNFERERLQRNVTLRQQVFTSLMQAYEEVRLREVRDTPVVAVFEDPWAASNPQPRGRLKRGLLGVFLGGVIGAVWVLLSAMLERRRRVGDPHATAFVGTVGEMTGRMPAFGSKPKAE